MKRALAAGLSFGLLLPSPAFCLQIKAGINQTKTGASVPGSLVSPLDAGSPIAIPLESQSPRFSLAPEETPAPLAPSNERSALPTTPAASMLTKPRSTDQPKEPPVGNHATSPRTRPAGPTATAVEAGVHPDASSGRGFHNLRIFLAQLYDGIPFRPDGGQPQMNGFYPVSASVHMAARSARPIADSAKEAAPTDALADQLDPLKLGFSYGAKNRLKNSEFFSTMRLIKGPYSHLYWDRFQKGRTVQVLYSWKTLFTSKIESADTKKIRELTFEDFRGVYTPRVLKNYSPRTIKILQEKLRRELQKYSRGVVVTPDSDVRIIRFMPYRGARSLPENQIADQYEVVPRNPVTIPKALVDSDKYLPKLVLLDLRLFSNGVPFELLEDMGKLQAAGVHFLLLSDKPQDEVERILTMRLNNRQRNSTNMIRFNLSILSNDGNSIYEYPHSFAQPLPSKRFSPFNQEIFSEVARRLGARIAEARSDGFVLLPPAGQSAEAWAAEFSTTLDQHAVDKKEYSVRIGKSGEQPEVLVRPTFLSEAIPHALEVLGEYRGLYPRPNHIMIISQDPAILGVNPGTIQPSVVSGASADGEELVDQSLAAMLGAYRYNRFSDLVVSHSSLKKEKEKNKRKQYFSGDSAGERIYTVLGDAVHTTLFNWAIYVYEDTGKFPSVEETVKKGLALWDRLTSEATGNLLASPGESIAGYRNSFEERSKEMHRYLAVALEQFPIVVGSELPNLNVIQRFKNDAATERDIYRSKFDLVLARPVEDGLELAIIDGKTGQKIPLPRLAYDEQVLLYDMLARRNLEYVPLPYGVLGKKTKVSNIRIVYIYFSGMSEPLITDWDHRIPFERSLRNQMKRIRKAIAKAYGSHGKPAAKKPASTGKRAPAKQESWDTLKLPRFVPGIKIKKKFAQQIITGKKKTEYRPQSSNPKPFVAIVQTFTDEEPGRAAEVVGFARIGKVTQNKHGVYEYHLSNVTPVEPYVAPNNKSGAVIWIKDTPVRGAKELKKNSPRSRS